VLLLADHRVSNQQDIWARFAVIVQERGQFVFSARRYNNQGTSSYICQLQEGTIVFYFLCYCIMSWRTHFVLLMVTATAELRLQQYDEINTSLDVYWFVYIA